jgi:hypothetical protein
MGLAGHVRLLRRRGRAYMFRRSRERDGPALNKAPCLQLREYLRSRTPSMELRARIALSDRLVRRKGAAAESEARSIVRCASPARLRSARGAGKARTRVFKKSHAAHSRRLGQRFSSVEAGEGEEVCSQNGSTRARSARPDRRSIRIVFRSRIRDPPAP